MQNITSVLIDGNLVADPELQKTSEDKIKTTFRVISNVAKGTQASDEFLACYFPVECWERLAENCNQYLRKGNAVTVQGELREDRWTDDEGAEHSQIKILARSVRFDKLS